MKLFVCIKQVPDTETKIRINSESNGIDTSSIKWIINPYDEYAIEEAIRLKESTPNSSVTVLTVGPKKRASEVLRTALAMGADEGILIDVLENVDSLLTAELLAAVIRSEAPFDLIFVGKSSIDNNASSVGPMVAQLLSIPHASGISKLSLDSNKITVEREVDGGTKEILQIQTPALVTTSKGLNTPRYANLPGIMKAKKKQLKEVEISTLNIALKAKTNLINYRMPQETPATKILTGEISQQVAELVRLLRDEAKVL